MKAFFLINLFILSFVAKSQNTSDYFQQNVDYKIDVTLNDVNHSLSGFEKIVYTNNSPDTLKFIYFHLWPNAYKNNKTAFARQKLESKDTRFYLAKEKDRGYIDSLNFKVNNNKISWQLDEKNIDIAKLILNEPLLPGKSIEITTPFYVKIPASFSRMGHEENNYQITQWYPKPAVYDKYGWHAFPYYDIGEFYSEYGSFDVSITLPENYVVAATGNLQTESEKKFLDSLANKCLKNKNSGISIYIGKQEEPPSSEKLKTIRYTEKNIHDFAWFANKKFNVCRSSVTLPHSFRKVTTWAFFEYKNAGMWQKATTYINDAVKYYSLWNGDYPYNNCTAVCAPLSAGGGMEYPEITVIGNVGNAISLDEVITHEVGHNWFYGVLGFNERRYPWMDEGINSFNEIRYMQQKYPKLKLSEAFIGAKINAFGLNQPYISQQYYTYDFVACRNTDQACNLSSNEYSDLNYGAIVYAKTAQSFTYLFNYLGKERFDKAMSEFYKRWQFKHPYPEDLQAVMEEVSGENLDWFFKDVLGTKKKFDYKIKSVHFHKKDSTLSFKIKRKGRLKAPVLIALYKQDTMERRKVFFTGKSKKITIPASGVQQISINPDFTTTDVNLNNNTAKTKALFKTFKPVSINFLGGFDNPDYSEIYWLPVMAWNTYNKFMTGLAIYSNPFFGRKFEYRLMPMYAWGNNQFAGTGRLAYNFFFDSDKINTVTAYVSAKQFSLLDDANYQKYRFGIYTLFQKQNHRKAVFHTLDINYTRASNSYYLLFALNTFRKTNEFFNINWEYKNERLYNPFDLKLYSTINEDFAQINAEVNYQLTYRYPGTGLDIRAYFGSFLYNNSNLPMYNISVSGNDGFSDYQYDDYFLGRTELYGMHDALSQQFSEAGGNMAVYSPYSTNKCLSALNLKSTILKTLPFKVYFNVVNYNYETYTFVGNHLEYDGIKNKTLWDSGIELNLFKNLLSFYFPIAYSSETKDYLDNRFGNGNYAERIRFVLRLSSIDLFKTIKQKETM